MIGNNHDSRSTQALFAPQMAQVLEILRPLDRPPSDIASISVEDLRLQVRKLFEPWNAGVAQEVSVYDTHATGAYGPVRVRLYTSRSMTRPSGALVFLHGGGWVVGDLDHEDASLRVLARDSGAIICSIDYVLAPEHPFPAAIQDTVRVMGWIQRHATDLGIDADRIGLGGSSAGANIAVASALHLRATGAKAPRCLLLNCGVFRTVFDTSSHADFGDGRYLLSTADMRCFLQRYLENPAQAIDTRINVASAELTGLPPTYLIAAELDPLRDDSRLMHEALGRAAVPSILREYAGVIHGFPIFIKALPAAATALMEAGQFLRTALGN